MTTAITAWLGVLISLGSFIVAAVALLKNSRTQKLLAEIEQSRRKEKEYSRKSAQLLAELENRGETSYRLIIFNAGACEARNTTSLINGKACNEYCAWAERRQIPPIIGPKSKVGMLMAFHLGCVPPFELELHWEDDSGEKKHHRTTITF